MRPPASIRGTSPLKVYFDGGARPNPGRIEVAVVARGKVHFFDDLGDGSSSEAEWLGLLAALDVAQALGIGSFDLLGDSRSIIDQASGAVPSRNDADRDNLTRFQAAAVVHPPRRLRWIARAQNLAGIALDGRRQRPR
nr:reverse transcriptase-like protein [uncultured Sphingomonas sp.]